MSRLDFGFLVLSGFWNLDFGVSCTREVHA